MFDHHTIILSTLSDFTLAIEQAPKTWQLVSTMQVDDYFVAFFVEQYAAKPASLRL